MGKQKGDSGRSKSRPSSSSLAASLLPSASAAAAVGFGGYVGSSRLDASLASEESTSFSDVDSEVSLHLKRLARKDPTTKLKALQTLCLLFKEKSAKDLVLIIPQWAFEYKRLLLDYNREVRRATHETMNSLVVAVGRDLAPHLKYLMGPWWFSQFDPVSEVSLAAKRSLQAAFPAQEKRLDALILCATEVFMYLEENLNLTPQTMSDKAVALDELEDMHQQVISSSLLALATLLDVLVSGKSEQPGFENVPKHASKARITAMSFAEKIFSAHKYFADFMKSRSPVVRSATYSALKSFIKNIPHAFNEGNMKILAAAVLGAFQEINPTCHSAMWDAFLLFSKRFPESWTMVNVQKTVLNRFWNFLRNGCFGSQQVSYPALVLFLGTVPPKQIVGEKFLIDFFHSLWEGRISSHSTVADSLDFFRAFKDCFLWGLHNASRYCESSNSVHQFRVTLVENILVKLLWQEYMSFGGLKNQNRASIGMHVDPPEHANATSDQKLVESLSIKYPMNYWQELGKCVVEILSDIYVMEHDLLCPFRAAVQEDCFGMFQQKEKTRRVTENVDQVIKFFALLEEHSVQKGEAWPLVYLVGPILSKYFTLIRSLDIPDGLRLLSVAVSLFGPRKIVRALLLYKEGQPSSSSLSDDWDKELESNIFMQEFKETFVPWCLAGFDSSSSARLDLLLALLNDECFPEQWSAVISFAIGEGYSKIEPASPESYNLVLLAMLLEKARVEIANRKVKEDSNLQQWLNIDGWHHDCLESAAVSIACSSFPYRDSAAHFLRAALGGSVEGNQFHFVSRNTLLLVYKEVSNKLLAFICESPFSSVRDWGFVSIPKGNNFAVDDDKTSINVLKTAQFALDVLGGTLYCLKTVCEEIELVSSILAAVFIMKWEHDIEATISDALDDGFEKKIKGRLVLNESLHEFWSKINNEFWESFTIDVLKGLGRLLVKFMRSVIFNEGMLNANKITSLCCKWMLEVLACVGNDQDKEQNLLNQILMKDDTWPSWITPDFIAPAETALLNAVETSTDIHASGAHKYVSFIDKLIFKIGINRVFVGHLEHMLMSSLNKSTHEELAARAWLAAEMLCMWKWPGGSATASFLPLLSTSAKRWDNLLKESLLDSIFNILLDGALVHGESSTYFSFNLWAAAGDELPKIQEPFLRALLSLIITLLKDDIWRGDKAIKIFELLANKLYIGEAINQNCLKILPPTVSVLMQALYQKSITTSEPSGDVLCRSEENLMQGIIKDWLRRILSFPPLTVWKTGEGMEELFQLVIACYPFRAVGITKSLKLERNISLEEKMLILSLFRKQRQNASVSAVSNQLPLVRMLLSKLMVISVGYCWKDFTEEDWEFFFFHLRSWIQSAVVILEEVTENVNDAIANSTTTNDLDVFRKLEQLVSISDLSHINVAVNALASFSLFSGICSPQQVELNILNPMRMEILDSARDRILEGILRLFFCTGITEAIASAYCHEAACIIATSRLDIPYFWELVASNVVNSSPHARERAVKSVEFWGLSKGAISSLYAILFSSEHVPPLQSAAYVILTTEPVSQWAIVEEDANSSLDDDISGDLNSCKLKSSSVRTVHLKEELSSMIEKLPYEVLEMDLMAHKRVNLFLAWSVLLSHLLSLPSLSATREQLVQYVQDSANSVILDCLFQHIPLELYMVQSLKNRDANLPAEASEAASAATSAISTGSLLLFVESLWPIAPEKMASLSGALFGIMLCVLPAYVRGWFTDLRDRSTSLLIETFTKTWCSPPLIVNELSQIKTANFADENFSVSVSKSANEVVATYTKDETGMDLVIRLPASYPLRHVDVECMRSLGISEVKQRKWLMSMMMFVRNQNGALAEAIRTWKNNFDKEFEGVEECPICYSVIHTTNHSLPRLACKTCKHKFHSACMYKWFSTSHKSSCPLCQSPF
ncbi:E3 ubiquitin-protein ligase listerin [Mercurialis annua]|uniref:E3 ubiquitin-protein ligase listerin n=1 Tax=Mercurialis annua TaxID=3986 RepID=UPI00215E2C24|nr:E3 ubiquitin-protein ligase listerin [Mercurialis annua]XP_050216479.1 E3 ubiquitin-protein ligase listerin [Mercurialis annua]